jgi:stress response protein SCP2
MKPNNLILLLFVVTITLFSSCKDQTFKKIKNATVEIHSLDGSSAVKIKSYNLRYNPKANGFIKLELETGAEYQAKSVDGGSFSSINSLLKEPSVLFDTTRKELIINKSSQQ